jgi:hypothetical protein
MIIIIIIIINLSDIVLNEEREETCLLIDTAIPDYSKFNKQKSYKTSKYKNLDVTVSRTWKVSRKIVPVLIGALGIIKKGLDQKLQLLPDHLSAIGLQKITLMNTAQVMPTVLG